MTDFAGKEILVECFAATVAGIIGKVVEGHFNRRENRLRLSEAVTAINQAIIETKSFIRSTGEEENPALSKLWHEALNKCIAADLKDGLPEFLYRKADYWGNPREWNDNPASLELVPKLKDLKMLCDTLLVKLNRR